MRLQYYQVHRLLLRRRLRFGQVRRPQALGRAAVVETATVAEFRRVLLTDEVQGREEELRPRERAKVKIIQSERMESPEVQDSGRVKGREENPFVARETRDQVLLLPRGKGLRERMLPGFR